MAARPGDWSLRHGTELRTVARELRHMGDGVEITKRFRRDLRATAAPLVPAVRASVRAIPSKQTRSRGTGLRAAIARAVTLRVRTAGRAASIAILVDGRKMPDREGNLPKYMEGIGVGRRGDSRWRHPVYGHDNQPWVQQEPHPYFFRVVRPLGLKSRIAVAKTLDGITRDITGHRRI